jgi:hypothetical protein
VRGDPTESAPPYRRGMPAAATKAQAKKNAKAGAGTGLSGDDLSEVLSLLRGADSVELKLTVPDSERRSAIAALELDPLDAQIRQVWFLDTPDLALDGHGVVARVRRIQGRPHDSVVKLRPVVPDQLPPELRRSSSFVVEVDAMPGGHVCSGSLKGTLAKDDVREAVGGRRPTKKLFSKEQRAFFATHAPDGMDLGDLAYLGPITVLKLKSTPREFGRRLTTELWFYPDGSRILELSTKCAPGDAFQVAAESKAFLARRGIDVTGEQQTKTRTALRFFSGELAGEEPG